MNLMLKILRKIELDKLLVLKDKNFIKVVTGVRRAGKSTLLQQFQELYLQAGHMKSMFYHSRLPNI